ncbi:lytic transglycosylase domain-containing protein [Ponticoccus sp. SC2-23]|uniref:lytic transglycosylase domain-containing protein n=1 Tax=Alexandriicola marinus TaxID=2081710 RepID=UPI000FDCAA0F|nr:lytic transglycosylase domain-containing protein [Alexandriicola marinus]MBM1221895.1 lytic transglycosylase domain-containing protein [Ponticoccus sp. SC6-9]MBM1226246.1 lytic transglycosylase domain-containing protein [Ponticoccus sp. SC6-15]MBM1230842.1 lytic transglycosylase domain-containing protein [Ponticoccus sp. SC6-38]MBM1235317.1 lytic transglycosylase domain-containing protein [Ponticoccus sp. SC6-45]MBM1239864.1 lytic transglycosylase domain-containing protein [Ponticoccus sp. 
MRKSAWFASMLAGAALSLSAWAVSAQDQTGLPETGFVAAQAAMDAGDWDLAYLLTEGEGRVAIDLVTWKRLRDGAGTFGEFRGFLRNRKDWPGLERIRERAEEAIPERASAVDVLTFFADTPPETGEGAVRLAAALTEAGRPDQAAQTLIDTWLGAGLSDDGLAIMLAEHGELLAPHHAARVDAQLWRWRISDAERLLDLLGDDDRALAEARIALIRNSADAAEKLTAVPAALRDHPGLAYDRYNRFADSGDYTEATEILLARTGSADTLGQPFRWASWRASLARWHMREGRARLAYDMARQHHLEEGRFYSDLEWLSGYLALRYLDDPALALGHFRNLASDVDSPISVARAGYWEGQAHIALGDAEAAAVALARAADHQTAFYGLLASELIGRSLDPTLAGGESFSDAARASLDDNDLVEALMLLLEAGDRGSAVLFAAELGRTLDRDELGHLGQMMQAQDETFFVVLLGKAGAARGMIIPDMYFPLHPLAEMEMPVSPELALSIARRESEFREDAGSPVGALGMMQLMPATAEEVAGELSLPYSRNRLITDWRYNVTLGARYLSFLREEFGDSPVMIAAGYNAGPSRPSTWMAERGDPRKGEVDVVDWIEHIPFTETRNYVMRVTESIPVYRARLTGQGGPVRFTQLLNGEPPFVRPRLRPSATDQTDAASDTGAIAEPAAPAPPDGPLIIRPIARPGG